MRHYPMQSLSSRGRPSSLGVITIWIVGIVIFAAVVVFSVKEYERKSDRCKAMGGHVVSITTYGNTYVPGGYVNGKYVKGGSVSTSTTTTTCNDPQGVVLFGM